MVLFNAIVRASWIAQWIKNQPANAGDRGDTDLIPGWGRAPGGENGNLSQYSCLENSMERGTWPATVHGVAKNLSGLINFHRAISQSLFNTLGKEHL